MAVNVVRRGWALSLFLLCSNLTSAHAADDYARALETWIDVLQSELPEPLHFSGYILVARHGAPIYARGFKHANADAGIPNTMDTSFRMASVSKQFTAAAVLKLQEEGRLRLDEPIRNRLTNRSDLPPFPAAWQDITIEQLVRHTAGIPDYIGVVKQAPPGGLSLHDLMALFVDLPLRFVPGARFSYSNSNYVVLTAIIESASGMSYGAYMDTLFAAAGLRHTHFGDADADPLRALGYSANGQGGLGPAHAVYASWGFGAGGIRSTPRDMLQWSQALLKGSVLTPASLAAMRHMALGGYGLGWFLTPLLGHTTMFHEGWMFGASTFFLVAPEDDVTVIVLANQDVSLSPAIGKAALAVALGDTVPAGAMVDQADWMVHTLENLASGGDLGPAAVPIGLPVDTLIAVVRNWLNGAKEYLRQAEARPDGLNAEGRVRLRAVRDNIAAIEAQLPDHGSL